METTRDQSVIDTNAKDFHISPDAVNIDERNQVLNHFNTFGLFDRFGNINPSGKKVQGIYHDGTRFLSRWELLLFGTRPLFLSSTVSEDNAVFVADLTNTDVYDGDVPDRPIGGGPHGRRRGGSF